MVKYVQELEEVQGYLRNFYGIGHPVGTQDKPL